MAQANILSSVSSLVQMADSENHATFEELVLAQIKTLRKGIEKGEDLKTEKGHTTEEETSWEMA
jgi:hypothetical protein